MVKAEGQFGGREELGCHIGQWQRCGSQELGNGRSLDHLLAQGITTHNRIEAVVGIRSVVHGAQIAIGIDQRVLTLDLIALPRLRLALDVAGVLVVHRVGEVVVGRCLHLHGLQQWLHNGRGWVVDGQLDGGGGTNTQDEKRYELEIFIGCGSVWLHMASISISLTANILVWTWIWWIC